MEYFVGRPQTLSCSSVTPPTYNLIFSRQTHHRSLWLVLYEPSLVDMPDLRSNSVCGMYKLEFPPERTTKKQQSGTESFRCIDTRLSKCASSGAHLWMTVMFCHWTSAAGPLFHPREQNTEKQGPMACWGDSQRRMVFGSHRSHHERWEYI